MSALEFRTIEAEVVDWSASIKHRRGTETTPHPPTLK